MELHVEQRSPEWFSLRKKYIGGSDCAPILGISPWKTAYDIWKDKTSEDVSENYINHAMQRGIDLEPEALRAFECETGYLMRPAVLVSQKNEFALASLDGYELDGRAACEIKCLGKKNHEIALDGQVPKEYIPQLQHQISVTGLDKIYYFSYNPDHEIKTKTIEVFRDDEYIKNLIEKESNFYHNHMLTGIPPETTLKIESEQWKLLSDEYKKLDFQDKENGKRKDEIKDLLIQISGSKNAHGNGITLQRIERKGIISYSSIPEIKNMDLEKYRKPNTSSWRISNGMD